MSVLRFLVATVGDEVLRTTDDEGWTPAHSAARGGHVDVIRFIVEQLGADAVLDHAFKPTVEAVAAKYDQKSVLLYLVAQAEEADYELNLLDDRSSGSTKIDGDESSESDAGY